MLSTKSLQTLSNSEDGLRVCVMRRIKPEYDFDIWAPILAPSEDLLQRYVINQEISWDEFRPLFLEELHKKGERFLNFLCNLATKQNVTLLCWEKKPDYCHRRLLAEKCQELYPDLKIDIA